MYRVLCTSRRGIYILLLLAFVFSPVFHSNAAANTTSSLLWSQVWDGQSILGPAIETRANSPATNMEIADDFDIGGTIERVVVSGYRDFSASSNPVVYGARVRFYQWLNGQPGALQAETFLSTGDPALVYDPVRPEQFDITLPTPFQATGKHFISVQVVMDAGVLDAWYWESANSGAARGATVFQRDNLAGSPWSVANNSDGAFQLYGTLTAPPRIDNLSATALDRSGRLRIFGGNFGGTQGSSRVVIGGFTAFVSFWSDAEIHAYVPEAASLGSVPVTVVTGSGTSNAASLNVTVRQPNGPARWRFQMDAMYAVPRPAVGPDGTIYAVDVFFHLYALAPDGGLRWLVNGAGDKGVDVGADGTVYTGSEDSISAYFPNGTLKWRFIQNPRAFILLGPNVGPDGNIYAVASEGLGVFSLTPQGQLRCSVFERYDRLIVDYQEVVFGMNGSTLQNYIVANHHFKGSRSDCSTSFAVTDDSRLQPAVGPDNTVYVGGMRYNPNGTLINSAVFPGPINSVSPAAVGTDGRVYVIQNQTLLHVMNADLTERFNANIGSLLTPPQVDPLNRVLVLGGANNYGMSGYIQATNVNNGSLAWRLNLVDENGNYNAVMSPARFTPDGSTAYLTTYMFGPNQDVDPYSYVYALATGAVPGPSLSSLGLNPTSVNGGSPSNGTVTLTGAAPSGGIQVALASSNPAIASVPSSITIPAGATSANFVVTTNSVAASTPVTISASYNSVTKTATLTVTPIPSTDTVTITLAQYWLNKHQLRVNATSTNASAVLKVYVTATGQYIGTLANSSGKYSGRFPWSSNPVNITVRSSLGGSASQAVTLR